MKGVILAAGRGSRLYPFTLATGKCLLPVYDKPAIHFPIQSLVSMGIEDIIIATTQPRELEKVLQKEEFHAEISIQKETEPKGQLKGLYAMKNKIGNEQVMLILGDIYLTFNIEPPENRDKCCIYVSSWYEKSRIHEYGVAHIGPNNKVLSFQEKPRKPLGEHVHMGTTFFPEDFIEVVSRLKDGEKDLTDVCREYLAKGLLVSKVFNESWFNIGTYEDLFKASSYRRESLHKD